MLSSILHPHFPLQPKHPSLPHTFNPFLIVNYQNPFLLMRHVWPLLALEDDGAGIQGFHGVPDILSHVHAVAAFRWVEDRVFNKCANPSVFPLILGHTIGKNKNYSYSVIIFPKTCAFLKINIHRTSSVCQPAISSDWPAMAK